MCLLFHPRALIIAPRASFSFFRSDATLTGVQTALARKSALDSLSKEHQESLATLHSKEAQVNDSLRHLDSPRQLRQLHETNALSAQQQKDMQLEIDGYLVCNLPSLLLLASWSHDSFALVP